MRRPGGGGTCTHTHAKMEGLSTILAHQILSPMNNTHRYSPAHSWAHTREGGRYLSDFAGKLLENFHLVIQPSTLPPRAAEVGQDLWAGLSDEKTCSTRTAEQRMPRASPPRVVRVPTFLAGFSDCEMIWARHKTAVGIRRSRQPRKPPPLRNRFNLPTAA